MTRTRSLIAIVDDEERAKWTELFACFDPKVSGRSLHLEVAGLLSTFKFFNPLDGQTHSAVGGGASAVINPELVRNVCLIGNGFYRVTTRTTGRAAI